MNLHRILLISIITMVVCGGVLTVLKLWFPIVDWDLYFKLMMTLGILTVLAGLVMVLRTDLASNKELKDNNYID